LIKVFFTEGTFGIDKDKTLQLCEGIIKRGLNKKIVWEASSRVDVVDRGVLLIVPPQRQSSVNKYTKRELGQEGVFPPLGLAYIAAVLQKNNIKTKIIDALASNLSGDDICEAVIKEDPIFVGITVLTQQYTVSLELANAIKKIKPCVKIVLGGPHIHFEHTDVIREACVDFCVRGEGEYTMLELVETVLKGEDLKLVKGITYKNGKGEVFANPDRDFIKNLDELPFPARDLLPMDKYRGTISLDGGRPFTAVLATRGCPFNCHFCSLHSMWKGQRRRSVNNVLEELRYIKKQYGIKYLNFPDDLLVLNRQWAQELFEGMVKCGLNSIKWDCNGRIGIMTEELLKKMKAANCQCINYGIEFGSQRLLDFTGKGIKIPQVFETIGLTNKVGIPIKGLFMMGYPTETRETLQETINLAKSLKMDYLAVSIVTPYPGTELYEYCKQRNMLKEKDWSNYDVVQLRHEAIQLEHISMEELLECTIKINQDFLMRPSYILRMVRRHPRKALSFGPRLIKRIFSG
jgi:radical SAM superfamily enzyme YgiQ (UPF0313 family)